MDPKVLFLWDSSQSVKRLTADEQAFITECDPIIRVYQKVCREAHEIHLTALSAIKPSERSNESRPTIIGAIIKSKMALAFPEFARIETSRRVTLHTKSYVLLFNKLDEETFLPSFPLSKNSQNIKYQMTAEGGDEKPIVFLGYTMSESYHDIVKMLAVYTNAGKILWKIDLDGIIGSDQMDETTLLPVAPLAPPQFDVLPSIEIQIKKTI